MSSRFQPGHTTRLLHSTPRLRFCFMPKALAAPCPMSDYVRQLGEATHEITFRPVPTGEERRHWQAEALARKDVEIKNTEEFYRASAMVSAQNRLKRYAETN